MQLTLWELKPGESGIIRKIADSESLCEHLEDIGIVPGTPVVCAGKSPCGDPKAYLIRNTLVALRNRNSKNIMVEVSNGLDR